jgi:CRISPR-associated dxthg domain-containing protein
MCRGLNITKEKDICRLKKTINQLSEDIIVPLVPVVKRIEQSFTNFIPDSNILNGLHAAQWCYDNHMYQQAITILQETIVTYICSNYDLPVTDIDARTLVNNAFYIIHNKLQQNEEKWKLSNYGKKEEALNKVRELIKLPNIEKLSNSFQTATDVRNDFNHAGFRPNPMSADKLAHKIKESIKEVHNIIFGDYVHQPL